jgi:hypothetical protein
MSSVSILKRSVLRMIAFNAAAASSSEIAFADALPAHRKDIHNMTRSECHSNRSKHSDGGIFKRSQISGIKPSQHDVKLCIYTSVQPISKTTRVKPRRGREVMSHFDECLFIESLGEQASFSPRVSNELCKRWRLFL